VPRRKVKTKSKKHVSSGSKTVSNVLANKFDTVIVPVVRGMKVIEIELPKQIPLDLVFTVWRGDGKDAINGYVSKFGHYPRTTFFLRKRNEWYMIDQDVSIRDVSLEPSYPTWRPKGEVVKVKIPKPPKIVRHLPKGRSSMATLPKSKFSFNRS